MGTRRSQGTVTQPSGAGNEENQLGFQSAASQAAKSKAFFCAGAEKWEDAFKERGVLSCSIRGLDSHSQILPAAAELAQGLFSLCLEQSDILHGTLHTRCSFWLLRVIEQEAQVLPTVAGVSAGEINTI